MKERRDYILRNENVFVGLEDSKKTWSLCIRSGAMIVHETSMPAQYAVLRNYFRNKFPECQIQVMYEAGFRGFELHDQLVADGWECVVRHFSAGFLGERKGGEMRHRMNVRIPSQLEQRMSSKVSKES